MKRQLKLTGISLGARKSQSASRSPLSTSKWIVFTADVFLHTRAPNVRSCEYAKIQEYMIKMWERETVECNAYRKVQMIMHCIIIRLWYSKIVKTIVYRDNASLLISKYRTFWMPPRNLDSTFRSAEPYGLICWTCCTKDYFMYYVLGIFKTYEI